MREPGARHAVVIAALAVGAAAHVAAEAALPPANETPDPVKPPLELLGEILLEAGDPGAAVDAFRRSLDVRRGRARSLIGLARAARVTGAVETAERAYRDLLIAWKRADPDLPELREARAYLESGP